METTKVVLNIPVISLKEARVKAKLSLKEVGKRAAISKRLLSSYEEDSSSIPPALARKLAEIYRYPVDYIFLGKNHDLINDDSAVAQYLQNPDRILL